MRIASLVALWAAMALALAPAPVHHIDDRQPASAQPLTFVRAIELPRVEGRMDHLALNASGDKLFVAALANDTVEVVDVKGGAHLRSLPGFHEPQGIGSIPDGSLVAVANGSGEGAQLIDANDYHAVRAVPLGDDADNVRYDATAKRLYVGYGSGALAAIDPVSGKVVATVKLAAHPESFQLERAGARIFVNVPNAGHIAVVDRNAMKIVTTWPVSTARANYPMTLDESGHRLFIGCRSPAKVLVYDLASGKATGQAEIVGDTDDMFFDTQRQRVYVAGGDGFIDVLDATGAQPSRLARITTAAGARTGLFSQQQGRFYLAVPHRGGQRAEIRVFEARE
jgi:DNA-binding beta-propeller fold protein YncE